jgi:hypothetical protein
VQFKNLQKEVIMRKLVRMSLILSLVVVGVLGTAGVALADPPQGTVDKAVCPVIGGPNNPSIHGTPATVTVPSNTQAIAEGDLGPSDVFWPARD